MNSIEDMQRPRTDDIKIIMTWQYCDYIHDFFHNKVPGI